MGEKIPRVNRGGFFRNALCVYDAFKTCLTLFAEPFAAKAQQQDGGGLGYGSDSNIIPFSPPAIAATVKYSDRLEGLKSAGLHRKSASALSR